MTTACYFSADYREARTCFRALAAELGWQSEALPVDGPVGLGPDSSSELTVDIALSPVPKSGSQQRDVPPSTLVLSSGLHGVEGFLGSAIQLQQMARWVKQPPPENVRVVVLHALNPYGFANLRRCDAGNRDLNRNFLIDHEYSGSPPLYPHMNRLLNPESPNGRAECFYLRAAWSILRHGYSQVQSTVAGGQYEFPRGLFFGGREPSRLVGQLQERLALWHSGSRRVVHFDFHTGLGEYANCQLLFERALNQRERKEVVTWVGEKGLVEVPCSKAVYQAKGTFGQWCVEQGGEADYLFAFAEFGTYGPLRVLSALREENRQHHCGERSSARFHQSKRALLEAFCPRSQVWRERTLEFAGQLCEQAQTSLSCHAKGSVKRDGQREG